MPGYSFPALGCRLRAEKGRSLGTSVCCSSEHHARESEGWLAGGGRVTSFCLQPAAARLASPKQLQQSEDTKKPGRRNQVDQCYGAWCILYGVLSVCCWLLGGVTSRAGNEVETRAPEGNEKPSFLWKGYCGPVCFSRLPV